MKKLFPTLALFLSIAMYGKEVPGPRIWYSISEKILKGGHQLMLADGEAKMQNKKKAPKVKALKVSTKFQQKKEIILPDFITPTVAKNVWFLPE